jgi:peptide chain release factor subunit 1
MKDISRSERLHLKNLIRELKEHKALHTEFVSVYIPADYSMDKIINHLAEEQGTASNIKSAVTKKNVQAALEKMIQHLKTIEKTPPHGFAVFSGNVASVEGKKDLKIWSVEPPLPLNVRIYRCDKNFVTNILEDMIAEKSAYGLVVLDRRDANLALLRGKTIIPLQKTHSEVPGKFRAGGQSAQRFARIREGAYKDHFKKIAEYMKDQFLSLGNDLKGIIIGGPGITVTNFLGKDYITGDVQKKIIGVKTLSYTGEEGLNELVDKSTDLLRNEEIMEEKEAMNEFFMVLRDNPDKASYGEKEVNKALDMAAVEKLLISEECPEEKIEQLEEKANNTGATMTIISTETREGVQLKNLGGVVAILRFPLEQ